MSTLLITRPKQDAQNLANKLTPKGFDCLIAPMLSIHQEMAARDDIQKHLKDKPQAIVLTSKHALEVFDSVKTFADIPTFASGARTGEYAQQIGMKNVTVTGENVAQLVEHIKANLKPDAGSIVYLSGKDITTELDDALPDFTVHRIVSYRAEKAASLTATQTKQLEDGVIDGVVLFTQRSAQAFSECCTKLDLRALDAYCLSQAVADSLDKSRFKSVSYAKHPTEDGMVELLVEKNRCKAQSNRYNKGMSEETEPKQPPAKQRSNGVLWLIAVLFVLQLAATGYLNYPKILREIHGYSATGSVTHHNELTEQALLSLDSRVGMMEDAMKDYRDEIGEVEQRIARAQHTENPISEVEFGLIVKRIDTLTQELETLKEVKVSNQQVEKLLAVKDQIESLQASVEQTQKTQWQHIKLLTAFDSVNKAVLSGSEYKEALQAFSLAATELPNAKEWIAILKRKQDQGIATLAQLQAQFADSIYAYWQSKTDDSNGEWSDIKRNLSQLIVIRKVGESHKGNDAGAIIARAEAALEKGDIQTAISEVEALPETAIGTFEPWLAAANHHLQARSIIHEMQQAITQTIKAENS